MLDKIILGLGTGLALGLALQRGRFCMYTTFRDMLLIRDFTLFRAYILALVIQMVLVQGFSHFGLILIQVPPFFWLNAMVGGFVFGLGMVLAGGCSSSSWYRVGEGMAGSLMAVLTFIIFAVATASGALSPLYRSLRLARIQLAGRPPTLSALLSLDPWVIIFFFALLVGGWLAMSSGQKPLRGWVWWKTGLTVGVIAGLAWVVSEQTGRNYGLSIAAPSASILTYLTTGNLGVTDWATFQVLGIPLGAFIGAYFAKEFRWRAPHAKRLFEQAAGGALMGTAAVIAGGCNIGNSLTGIGVLSLHSLMATLFIILGVWSGTYIRAPKKA
jgi:hypothetical protein